VLPPEQPAPQAVTISPGLNPVMAQALREMQAAADKVMNGFHARAIEARPKSGAGHFYRFTEKGPLDMLLGEPGGTPHLEAAHEMGHFWAHANLSPLSAAKGVPVDFTRDAPEWLDAALASEPVKALTRMLAETKDETMRERLFELLQPAELWARSFAQWLALRGENKTAAIELSQVISGLNPGQPPESGTTHEH